MPRNSSRTRMSAFEESLEPRLGVHVGEGTDVQIAVQRCERNRAAGVFHPSAYFSLILLASSMPDSALPMPSP